MSKRALLRLATSICLMFCVMIFAFNITAHAEPGDDSSEVTLNYKLRGYTGFQLFISESDDEAGVKLVSGDEGNFQSGSTKLNPEKTYYLHILSTNDTNTYTRLVGKFELSGSGLEFGNNNKILTTNLTDFKFSLNGFGKEDKVVREITKQIMIPNDVLPAEYLVLYKNTNQRVYLSAVIKPVQSVLKTKANIIEKNVNLTWNAVPDAVSYSVERSTVPGGPYTQIASDLTETSYLDKSTSPNTTYYYVVKAKISDTETITSPEVSATLPPETPTVNAKLKIVLEPEEKLQLSVDDDLNVNTQMAWTSSEPTVATVSEKGIVTALAPGNTVITVKSADGSYTDYINVLVVENADDYRLAIDLKIGETARLTADDFTNTANITWAPMDSSIANVTTKGKVTALSKGLVLISAKDADGNIIGRVYVRVRE